jgi:prophage regulatory protein
MLTWLGDDVEIVIRPRVQRTKRGVLRVLQAAAVENPEHFEPVRLGRGRRVRTSNSGSGTEFDKPEEKAKPNIHTTATTREESQLLNKHAVETMTSLDITTIYRKMSAGKFPQPVRVGPRRVAWRMSDIVQWQQQLEVGTERLRRQADRSRRANPGGTGGRR